MSRTAPDYMAAPRAPRPQNAPGPQTEQETQTKAESDSFPRPDDSFEELFRRVFGPLPERRPPSGGGAPIVPPPPADQPTGSGHE